MSLDASRWAWQIRQKQKKGGCLKALKKLVLLSLADRASEEHCAYPSMSRLVEDTEMDRKTVLKIIEELIEDGLIIDTGERKGKTKQVKVYQLVGVKGRESEPSLIFFDSENDDSKSPKDGTVPTMEQYQQFHERVPTIPSKSPNVGTRNLSKNLLLESKNKKDWLCFKKLRQEIFLADENLDFEHIAKSKWAEREKRAFEIYNAGRDICDDLMNYHFADWLINAYHTKYEGRPDYNSINKQNRTSLKREGLSHKQILAFAAKLAHHPGVAGKIGAPGESFDQLGARIALKLGDPVEAKKLEPFLREVGFKGELLGTA
ncbi:helix-turn-helix domain-containing protein [Acinetobacter stercoris]|uniref:Helix-turn-helix domain-containing protein n=1 Tax=Acinetobacter stercoris TaxID=2126983 RepID=A0A2U3N3T1_9GAMM|nr:helix-turn-helix domain-containing protein [Acinetobacter stercoris]SPL72293.1 hypothetical protein KPC_3471 [Acinetobacter stercoris]